MLLGYIILLLKSQSLQAHSLSCSLLRLICTIFTSNALSKSLCQFELPINWADEMVPNLEKCPETISFGVGCWMQSFCMWQIYLQLYSGINNWTVGFLKCEFIHSLDFLRVKPQLFRLPVFLTFWECLAWGKRVFPRAYLNRSYQT